MKKRKIGWIVGGFFAFLILGAALVFGTKQGRTWAGLFFDYPFNDFGALSMPMLKASLRGQNTEMSRRAAYLLSISTDPAAVSLLTAFSADPSAEFDARRTAFGLMLGNRHFAGPSDVQLIEIATDFLDLEDGEFRHRAWSTLGDVDTGSPRVVAELSRCGTIQKAIRCIQDANEEIQSDANRLLERLTDTDHFEDPAGNILMTDDDLAVWLDWRRAHIRRPVQAADGSLYYPGN